MKKLILFLSLILISTGLFSQTTQKSSERTPATSIAGTELIDIVQAGVSKTVTPNLLMGTKGNIADVIVYQDATNTYAKAKDGTIISSVLKSAETDDIVLQAASDVYDCIIIYPGTYNITATWSVITTILEVSTPKYIAGIGTVKIVQHTAGIDVMHVESASVASIATNFTLENVFLDGNSGAGHGLHLSNIMRSLISNVTSNGNNGGYSFYCEGALDVTFIKPYSHPVGGTGSMYMGVNGTFASNANTLIGPEFISGDGNTTYGLVVDGTGVTSTQFSNTLIGGSIETQTTNSLKLTSVYAFNVSGTWFEGAGSRISLTNCTSCNIGGSNFQGMDITGCAGINVSGFIGSGTIIIDATSNNCFIHDGNNKGHRIDNYSLSSNVENITSTWYPNTVWYMYGNVKANIYDILNNTNLHLRGGSVPVGLTAVGTPTITQTGLGLADGERPFGNYAIKLANSTVGDGLVSDILPTQVGDYVTVEAYVKFISSPDGGVPRIVSEFNGANASGPTLTSSTTDWQKVQLTFYHPAGYSNMQILFGASSGKTATYYLGGVRILINKAYSENTSGSSATIATTNTYVDVVHGLDRTPTQVQVTPTSNLDTRTFWVSDKSSSTFRINISAADGAVAHTFDWTAKQAIPNDDMILTSTGDGSGVTTLTMAVGAETIVTLGANATFYSDAGGTADPSQTWTVTTGADRTIYLKCTTGTTTMSLNKANITRWVAWTSGANAASIGGSITNFTALEYLSVDGNNTLSGSITGLTALTWMYVQALNTISGDISGLTSLTYVIVYGGTTITGDIAGLVLLAHFKITGYNTVTYSNVTNITGLDYLVVPTTTTLTSANVNQLLADFWANKDVAKSEASRVINIAGNAASGAPTGQGITDKAALQAYHSPTPPGTADVWTVTTR